MAKAARNTELLQSLVQALEEKRTDLNTHRIDYIVEKIIEKGWTEKQLLARLRQTHEADTWQAAHGSHQYRAGHRACMELFDFVSEFLTQQVQA